MTPALIIPARNKAPYVGYAVHSVLAQTFSPMKFIFSDQGSTDGTLDIIKKEVQGYNGPNEIRIMECPETERSGMHGLVDHINWLHDELDDIDLFMWNSADDFSMNNRVERTMQTINGLDREPIFFATAVYFADHYNFLGGNVNGITARPEGEVGGRWVNGDEHVRELIGSSATSAWTRKLLDIVGPKIPHHSLLDIHLPYAASLYDGFYFLNEPLGVYVTTPDANNTGLGGRLAACKTDTERWPIQELVRYELSANAFHMVMLAEKEFEEKKTPQSKERHDLAMQHFINEAVNWVRTRNLLTEKNLNPLPHPGRF